MPIKVDRSYILYKCQHCEYHDTTEDACLEHEKKHAIKDCKHTDVWSFVDRDTQELSIHCRICVYQESVFIDTSNTELMKEIVELIKTRKNNV